MFSLKRKQPPILGIDISSTCIKVLELSKSKKGYKVESFAIEPLPANCVVEKEIQDIELIAEPLKRAIKTSGSKAKHAALAVAGSAVITKTITMPAGLSDDDMERQIMLEADQYIPYPLEEVHIDFETIAKNVSGEETESTGDSVEVLLAACRSENVGARSAAAEICGLTPQIVDIEAYCIEHAYQMITDQIPDYGVDKTTAIIDIGATMTALTVIDDGKMIYNREQPFGGKQLTEEIMRRYGLSFEDAGRVKKHGGLPDNYEAEVLLPFKETMAQQVGRFLQFFYSSSELEHVDYIALAGGCAAIPGIAEMVQNNLNIQTGIADPFNNIQTSSRVAYQRLQNDGPSMLIALGLAMRGIE